MTIYIDPRTNKRIQNLYAEYPVEVMETRDIYDENNEYTHTEAFKTTVIYPNLLNPENRKTLGIIEIEDPVRPEDFSDETYYVNQSDDAPYIIYTRKSQEQLDQLAKAKIQQEIASLETSITPRRIREALLTGDNSFIQSVEDKIAELRSQIK